MPLAEAYDYAAGVMVENMMHATPRKASAPSSRSGRPTGPTQLSGIVEPRLTLMTLGVNDVPARARILRSAGFRGVAGRATTASPSTRRAASCSRCSGARPRRGCDGRRQRAGSPASRLPTTCRSEAEVEAVLAEAAAAGGRIVKPAKRAFWGGYSGYFADPDGHLWEVAHNPDFPLDAEGTAAAAEVRTDPAMNHDSYSDDYIADILGDARTIAMVGASAHHQPAELLRHEVSARQGLPRDPRQSRRSPARRSWASPSTPRSPTCPVPSTSSTSSAPPAAALEVTREAIAAEGQARHQGDLDAARRAQRRGGGARPRPPASRSS